MQYVRLGRTGLKVSRLCLGMMTYGSKQWRPWVLDQDQARPFFRRALDAGINYFDTADSYSFGGSEQVLGSLIRDAGIQRDNLVIATKVYMPISDDVNDRGLSRKHILSSVDRSLQHLQMDYVDLYQIHRWDYETPIEETLEALHDVIRAGKARYIGASSMFAWQFTKAQYTAKLHGWSPFVSMQNHYNLIYREEEREMIPCCIDLGVALVPWSPMARGFFAGSRRKGDWGESLRARTDAVAQGLYYREQDFAIAERVQQVARSRGVTGSQIALAWVLAKDYITAPIIGASRLEHLDQAIAALDLQLAPEEVSQLEQDYQMRPVLGHT